MPCYSPLLAFRGDDGAIGFRDLGGHELALPCGRCIGCRLDRADQWTSRLTHEASLHDVSSFVTLTYAPEHCPLSLRYADFQLFAKRLRRQYGSFRHYTVGEYGEQLRRPHFHSLLFGLSFADRVPVGKQLWTSVGLAKVWGHGFVSIGDVTRESIGYVARYAMKKVYGDSAAAHYRVLDAATGEVVQLEPEFSRMSRRPGIGADWIKKFRGDVYGEDRDAVVSPGGVKRKPPRFYDKKLKEVDPYLYDHLVERRIKGFNPDDATEERLRVRAAVARARVRFKVRNKV